MQEQQKTWTSFQQRRVVSSALKSSIAVVFALLILGISLGLNVPGAHAQSSVGSVNTSLTSNLSYQNSKILHSVSVPNISLGNQFPWPQCTWWANERYRQFHGIYVPWTTNSDAWEWTARAYQFHWHVSNTPSVGWIMNLQPWVQGAYGLGHVGVVEQVLGGGYFIASNMNWGYHPTQVTYVKFHAASGVTFIHQ